LSQVIKFLYSIHFSQIIIISSSSRKLTFLVLDKKAGISEARKYSHSHTHTIKGDHLLAANILSFHQIKTTIANLQSKRAKAFLNAISAQNSKYFSIK